jgi:hypothetical protein
MRPVPTFITVLWESQGMCTPYQREHFTFYLCVWAWSDWQRMCTPYQREHFNFYLCVWAWSDWQRMCTLYQKEHFNFYLCVWAWSDWQRMCTLYQREHLTLLSVCMSMKWLTACSFTHWQFGQKYNIEYARYKQLVVSLQGQHHGRCSSCSVIILKEMQEVHTA